MLQRQLLAQGRQSGPQVSTVSIGGRPDGGDRRHRFVPIPRPPCSAAGQVNARDNTNVERLGDRSALAWCRLLHPRLGGAIRLCMRQAAEELDEILLGKSLALPAAVREWCLLAARWSQGGLNVWISPQELAAHDGMACILTDTDGIKNWGGRAADHDIEDPPVYDLDAKPSEIDFPSFTSLVAVMIVNDVIFHPAAEPVELNPGVARASLTCFAPTPHGDFYADATLDAATVVMYAYAKGPAYGKARTPAGYALLQRLQLYTARPVQSPPALELLLLNVRTRPDDPRCTRATPSRRRRFFSAG